MLIPSDTIVSRFFFLSACLFIYDAIYILLVLGFITAALESPYDNGYQGRRHRQL